MFLFLVSSVFCDPIKLDFGNKTLSTTKHGELVELEFPAIKDGYKNFIIFHNSDKIEREDKKDMTPIIVNYTKLNIKPKSDNLQIYISVGFLPSDCDTFNFHLGQQKKNKEFTASKKACFLYSNIESIDISISQNIERYSVTNEMLQKSSTTNLQSQIFILKSGTGMIYNYSSSAKGYNTGFYYIDKLNSLKIGNEIKYIEQTPDNSFNFDPASLALFIVIPLLLLVAIIIGGYFCFFYKKRKDEPKQAEAQNDQQEFRFRGRLDDKSSSTSDASA